MTARSYPCPSPGWDTDHLADRRQDTLLSASPSVFAVVGAQFTTCLMPATAALFATEEGPLPASADTPAVVRPVVSGTPVTSAWAEARPRGVGVDLIRQRARPPPVIMHRHAGHHRRIGHPHPPGPGLVGLAHTVAFRLRDAPGWGCPKTGCTVITSDYTRDIPDGKRRCRSESGSTLPAGRSARITRPHHQSRRPGQGVLELTTGKGLVKVPAAAPTRFSVTTRPASRIALPPNYAVGRRGMRSSPWLTSQGSSVFHVGRVPRKWRSV
jgi:hypothetical protein